MYFKLFSLFVFVILFISGCKKSDEEVELLDLVKKYDDLVIIDAHNHDSPRWKKSMRTLWNKYSIDKIVLFGGYISQSKGIEEDKLTFEAYKEHPDRFYPFMCALNIREESGLEEVKRNFDKGFVGIGEVVATSTNSPVVSNVEWKGNHPMDGLFPEVYELCAKYNKPILLHIDPPFGNPIDKLEVACDSFPETIFIFAHANAFSSPRFIRGLLEKHDNLYIDYFAGFDAFNNESSYDIEDYVEVIEDFPDKFLISTDSGYGMEDYEAYLAIYRLIDLLSVDTREKVAHLNFENFYK